jgi:F0F1-type ATP synthase membrane subunit a
MAKLAPLVMPMALRGIFGLGNGFIQAFVFSMLAVAYINLAVEH